MGRPSKELDSHALGGKAAPADEILRVGVHHEGEIHAGEASPLHHVDFSPSFLLAGGSDDLDFTRNVLQDGSQGDPRPHGGRGDDVVAAGVTEALQCVVLREECHCGSFLPSLLHRPEGGFHGAEGHFHGETVPLQQLLLPPGRLPLLEGRLGASVDVAAQLEQFLPYFFNPVYDAVFHEKNLSFF